MKAKTFLDILVQDYHKKKKTYDKLGFKFTNGISSRDWEVFVALLLNDRASGKSTGADLSRYEVKSVKQESYSCEYQYHKKTGLQKLESDKNVDHVFVLYSLNYLHGAVMVLNRSHLVSLFDSWEPDIRAAYSSGLQRCRKQVPTSLVRKWGKVVYQWAIRVD